MLQPNQSATFGSYQSEPVSTSTYDPEVFVDEEELFTIQTANSWMEQANKRPVPKMLFGKFWFEGELCILFADSNLGKSILAVQIANSISRGINIDPFPLEAKEQPVLYFDFELSEKQFEARYSIDFSQHYHFSNNFYRAEMNPDSDMPPGFRDFDEYLSACVERSIVQSGSKVLVIDNLTYLRGTNEKAKDALPLMKHLKALKNRYGLSILALAHTPKRDMSLPLTRNDLQGSKMLMNFCDSAFAIGESVIAPNMRYLKQIKQRNTNEVYGAGNVCVCEVNKPLNFLQYEFNGYGMEDDHLRKLKRQSTTKSEYAGQIMALQAEGRSLREIGAELGISHSKVNRIINAAQAEA
jgi:DNA-binding CsgD family transcriptional regulator